MLSLIVQGMGFGFNAGVLPGPLQSYLISTTLSQGWRRGILVVLSPLLTDAPIILLMTFFLGQLDSSVIRAIQIAGGTYVLWLAWSSFRAYRAGEMRFSADSDLPSQARGAVLARAVTMNFLSAGPYIFWGAVTGPLLIEALEQSLLHAVGFLLAFYGTFLMIMTLLVLFFDRLRTLDPRVTNRVFLVAIAIMAFLGGQLIVQGALG